MKLVWFPITGVIKFEGAPKMDIKQTASISEANTSLIENLFYNKEIFSEEEIKLLKDLLEEYDESNTLIAYEIMKNK